MQKEHIYIKQQQLCGYNAQLFLGLLRIEGYQTTIKHTNTHKHTAMPWTVRFADF